MKIPGNVYVIGAGVIAVVGLLWFFKKQASAAVDAVANVNAGTPYEGAGVVGTLGNAANTVSGGTLADFGSWIGGAVFDITHPAPEVELQTRKQAVGDNFWDSITSVFTP